MINTSRQIGKVLSAVGSDFITPRYEFTDVKKLYVSYDFGGINTSVAISVYYSYVIGGDQSDWLPFTTDLTHAIENTNANIGFRIKIDSNLLNNNVVINGFDFQLEQADDTECCDTIDGPLVITDCNIDLVNGDYLNVWGKLHTGLNESINNRTGVEVRYIKLGDGDIDPLLHEYYNNKAVDYKCVKLSIDGNKLPTQKPSFSEWGLEFDNFEVDVPIGHFRDKFGKDATPTKGDVVIFPKFDRIYQVASYYTEKTVSGFNSHYNISLIKYDKASTTDYGEWSNVIDDIKTVTDVFADDLIPEMNNSTFDETQVSMLGDDDHRSYISNDLIITDIDILSSGNSLIDQAYDLSKISGVAVKYNVPTSLDSWSLTFAHKYNGLYRRVSITDQYVDDSGLNLVLDGTVDAGTASALNVAVIDSTIIPIQFLTSNKVFIQDADSLIDTTSPILMVQTVSSIVTNKYDISLLPSGIIVSDELSRFYSGLDNDDWYYSCITYSYHHKTFGCYTYKELPDNKMLLMHSRKMALEFVYPLESLIINGGYSNLANISLWNKPIPQDRHQSILSSNQINNAKALVIHDRPVKTLNGYKLGSK